MLTSFQPGPRYVWLPVLLRGFFIPFFMYCNFNPDSRTFPVFISNDVVYVIGGIIFAFTSGYFSSLCMMYAPRYVDDVTADGLHFNASAACLRVNIM